MAADVQGGFLADWFNVRAGDLAACLCWYAAMRSAAGAGHQGCCLHRAATSEAWIMCS